MKRFGCGNAHSVGTGALTDVYLGCEAMEEVHNWGIDQVADIIRAELYRSQSSEDNTVNITGVRLHETWEFGVGQEYQDYFVNQLGGALVPNTAPNHTDHSDVELAIGLDLRNRDSFVMPMTEPGMEIFRDPELHRRQKDGVYGWLNLGLGVLDLRRVLALSF